MREPTELDWSTDYVIRGVGAPFPGQHIAAALSQYAGVEIEYPPSGEPCYVAVPLLGVTTEVVLMSAVEYIMEFTQAKPEVKARVSRWMVDKYGEAPR